jgi:hypothetical protein
MNLMILHIRLHITAGTRLTSNNGGTTIGIIIIVAYCFTKKLLLQYSKLKGWTHTDACTS